MSPLTLKEMLAEFDAAGVAYTAVNGHHEALCPACEGFLTLTEGEDGQVTLGCSECDGSQIGNKLHSRTQLRSANGNGQEPVAQLAKASTMLGLRPDDPLVHVWRQSPHVGTPLNARTEAGVTLRWERQRDMLKPEALALPVLATTGVPGPEKPLTKQQAHTVYKLLVEASETFEQQVDALDEVRAYLSGFEDASFPLSCDFTDPAARFLTIDEMKAFPRFDPRAETVGASLLTDLSSGHRYIRSLDFADYVRKGRGVTVEWAALMSDMAELGWHGHELQAWEPDVPRREARHPHFRSLKWTP